MASTRTVGRRGADAAAGTAKAAPKAAGTKRKPPRKSLSPSRVCDKAECLAQSVVAIAEAAAADVVSATAEATPSAARRATKTVRPATLVQRVYTTIAGELGKLEQQTGLKSQDRERASRALAQMVNALEKAVDMQRAIIKSSAKGGDAKNKEALAHAEDLRRAIAERLARLNRKRPPARGAE